MMLKFSYVPDAFGIGTIIPLLKGDDCDPTVRDNYRAITISPCISKVFELCLSSLFFTNGWAQISFKLALRKVWDVVMPFSHCGMLSAT